MSDTSQGEGWWIASDGKWYAPEQAAGYVPPAPPEPPPAVDPQPAVEPPPTTQSSAVDPTAVTPSPDVASVPPPVSPAGPPVMPPPGSPMATGPGEVTPPVAAKKSNGCLKAFIIVACIVAFLGIGTVILFGFVLNKAANTISDKVNAQQKIENETGIKSSSFNTTNPPQKDISAKDMTCTTDASGNMTASGQLTNHSSKSSSYLVEISFRQNGSEIGTASDLVLGVDAGKTGSWSATSTVGASGGFTCKIYSIDRWDTGSIPPVSTPN